MPIKKMAKKYLLYTIHYTYTKIYRVFSGFRDS